MFLGHFNLREQPFGVTPDPAYLYLSRTHQSALDALSTGVSDDRGFMAVIAEPGMGKTTLLYHLLDQLRDTARTMFIFQTQCDSREFFGHLLTELGMNPAGMDIVTMHERLNKALFSEMLAGKRVVLIVDEAQNLGESMLETVRLLSNFEVPHAKLLQIIFAGQPHLATNLASPALAQLRQRVTVVAHLSPFRIDETSAYIRHRLKVAGYSGEGIFNADAVAAIAQHSDGIPRVINNLCFNAMRIGFERGLSLLGPDVISEAIAQLRLEPVVRESPVPKPAMSLPTAGGLKPNPAPVVARLFPAFPSASVRHVNKSLIYGSAALALLILVGMSAISHSLGKRVTAAMAEPRPQRPLQQAVEPTLGRTSGNTPQAMTSLQFLLISAQPNDTLREISLRYLGRFDDEILSEIHALNPELTNLNQLTPGQLLRVPFPSATLTKVFDSDSVQPSVPRGTVSPAEEVSQLLPREPTASATVNVASARPLAADKRELPVSPTPKTFSNQSHQPSTRPAEVPADSAKASLPLPSAVADSALSVQTAVASIPAVSAPASPVNADLSLPKLVQAAKVEPAELVSRKDPVYPAIAKSSRISGSVEMHFKIGTDGRVFDAIVVKGSPLLGQAALQALQDWRYKPALLNGSPVESEGNTVFTFKGD